MRQEEDQTGSATWNDSMYVKHPTPYGKGVAGFIQSKRVRRVLEYAQISPSDRVLEIGCESGRLCAALPRCARIVACDISPRALEDAQRLLAAKSQKAEFILADAVRPLPFQRGEFNVIICSEMLEHVTAPETVISNIAAICDSETRVLLTVPIEAPKVVLKRWLQKFGVLRILFPGIEPGQSEWHLHAFSRRALREITERFFVFDRASVVWGCHLVARCHPKSVR